MSRGERNPTPEAPERCFGRVLFVLVALAAALAGCPSKPKPDPNAAKDAGVAPGPSASSATPSDAANAAHGKELVGTFQCNRCHDGTGYDAAPQNKHCVHCHKDILEDRFKAAAASIVKWKPRVKELADAPSLDALGKRATRRWVEQYLLQPTHLRPNLHQFMPRLALTGADARDIAAYLVPEADAPTAASHASAPELKGADLGRGRQLLDTKGCGFCHAMTGVAAVAPSTPPAMDARELERGKRLAPDLRFVRERVTASKLTAWLRDPKAVKADTPMPKVALTDDEVRDLSAYLLTAEIASPPARPPLQRLPILTRKVTFKEVDEKVFHRTCWHCHSEPDYAIGDGGPGNSGGLGFKPRGLNLSDYNGVAAGYLDDNGERASIFANEPDGLPRLVRALVARHEEESGASTAAVRGMPLGYEPLSAEEIQLVESWVVQGRPR